MAVKQPLTFYISSKMTELSGERTAVQAALDTYITYGWLLEKGTSTQPEMIRSTRLAEVAACDVYISLFWLSFEPTMIEEFEYARRLDKPCLIYEKYVDVDQRQPELTRFLHALQQTDHPVSRLTLHRFNTSEQLADQVRRDVMYLLVTHFRETRRQPPPEPTSNSATTGAKNKGIALGTIYGNITQYTYRAEDDKALLRADWRLD